MRPVGTEDVVPRAAVNFLDSQKQGYITLDFARRSAAGTRRNLNS